MPNRNMAQQLNTQGRGIKSAFNNHHICRTDRDTSLAINHLQKTKSTPTRGTAGASEQKKKKKKKQKEKKRQTSRHTKRRSVNKNDATKPFVKKASDSYTSGTQVIRVYTPTSSHTL